MDTIGDTIKTPDPEQDPQNRKVVHLLPTSWIESKHEPLPHEADHHGAVVRRGIPPRR